MDAGAIISIIIILAVLGFSIAYIIRAKRRGEKCIGCPYSKTCNKNCNCNEQKKSD